MTPFTDIDAKYGLPSGMTARIMQVESGGDPNAVSSAGAQGKFQVMPATQRDPGYGVAPFSGNDPNGAAAYFAAMRNKFGSIPLAAAAYNWGPGNLEKYGIDKAPAETQAYVQKVTDGMNQPPENLMQMLNQRASEKQEPSAGLQNAFNLLQQRAAGKLPNTPKSTGSQQSAPVLPPTTLQSFEQGMRDPLDAGAQMLVHALPQGVVNAVNQATGYVNNLPVIGPITKELGMTPATANQVDTGIQKRDQAYEKSRGPNAGLDVPRFLGQTLTTLPLMYGLPAGGSALSRIGLGAASGAGMGLLNPVTTSGNFAEQKAKQALSGGITGGILAPVAGAIGRVVSPNVSQNVKTLMSHGITPTPGQIAGGVAQRLEDKLTSVPILGDVITNARKAGLDEFNRALYNKALAPIGEKSTAPVGREGVSEVSQKLSDAYNSLLPKLTFEADAPFMEGINNVRQMASTLPKPEADQFENILNNRVLGKLTPGGRISGETFKSIESDLGKMAQGYSADPSFDKRQLGAALKEVQSQMRQALTRSNPDYAAQLSKINEGYSNYAILRNAAARQGSKEGFVTPGQFSGAVRQSDRSVGKGNFARGTAKLQNLSDAAKGVLMNQYPDSGTAGRGLLYWLGTGGLHFVSPPAAVGAGLLGLPYLPIGRKLAAGALTSRPAFSQPLAAGIRRLLPPAAGLLAPQLTATQ